MIQMKALFISILLTSILVGQYSEVSGKEQRVSGLVEKMETGTKAFGDPPFARTHAKPTTLRHLLQTENVIDLCQWHSFDVRTNKYSEFVSIVTEDGAKGPPGDRTLTVYESHEGKLIKAYAGPATIDAFDTMFPVADLHGTSFIFIWSGAIGMNLHALSLINTDFRVVLTVIPI